MNRSVPTVNELFQGIKNGNRGMLARAITLVESQLATDSERIAQLVGLCLPLSGKGVRIGISGIPGAGKSTLIESWGSELISSGRRLAVLAVDPTSERSRGSILGDKTRMTHLSGSSDAFVRPSPSSLALGGVAPGTRESIILCEAAGYDTILVETVGIGQSEALVRSMVDFFMLFMITGAGDSLQSIKRGVIEMADAIVFTKADGENKSVAERAASEMRLVSRLMSPLAVQWDVPVLTVSALTGEGVNDMTEVTEQFVRHATSTGHFSEQRRLQSKQWYQHAVDEKIRSRFFSDPAVSEFADNLEKDVLSGRLSAPEAANRLLDYFYPADKN